MSATTPHILEERGNGVLTLRIQRPDKKNALTVAMYDRLREAVAAADADPDVRAILITGPADCFTAGHDLQDFQGRATSATPRPRAGLRRVEAPSAGDPPLVGAVNGPATGIGTPRP